MTERFHILHTESSYGLGGQEYRILREARAMRQRGHEVVIAAPSGSQLLQLSNEEGLVCEAIPVGITGWMRLVPIFLHMIKKYHIQIIHTHGSQDSWLASLAGRLSFHRPIIVRMRHKSTPVARTFRHHVLYRCLPHAIITTGEAVRQQLMTQIHVSPARVFSIATGVDLTRFQPSEPDMTIKHSLGLGAHEFLVGTVAFLRPEKGLEVFIDALALLQSRFPQMRGVIVGDGPEYGKLYQRICDHQLERMIVLAGFRKDVPELLKTFDVFVLSSHEEGLPQTVLQALAVERAVVASSVGSVPEVIRDGETGLLVPSGDPFALSKKLEFLLGEPRQRAALGYAGSQVVQQNYSLAAMVRKTEQVYASLRENQIGQAA